MRARLAAAALAVALSLSLPLSALAASPNRWATCWFEADGLHIASLPDDSFGLTTTRYPSGDAFYPNEDGTFFLAGSWPSGTEMWVTQRGGGPTLYRFGRQLNDYKVIAMCSVP